MYIHMHYAVFKPAIPVESVNIFAVYYSHNPTAACHSLSTTLQPAASKYPAVAAASIPWVHLLAR